MKTYRIRGTRRGVITEVDVQAATVNAAIEIGSKSPHMLVVHSCVLLDALPTTAFDVYAGAMVNASDVVDRARDSALECAGNVQAGRPSTLAGGKRVNVYLDTASLTRASELGSGNVSEGIRIALGLI